ncbi:MAG: hypothetical protein R3Y26_12235 [Rikenellaceae bacterium]
MKISKIIFTLFVTLMCVSCGTTNQATTTSQQSTEITEGNDVILLAEADPIRRAYGDGTHFQEATARRAAEANARAALASAIQTAVIQSFDAFAGSISATSSENGIANLLVEEQYAQLKDAITTISKECVTNTVAIKIQRYKQDTQYKIYVCLEYKEDVASLAKTVESKLKQTIPEEVKESIAFEQFLHEKKMEKAFANYKPIAE